MKAARCRFTEESLREDSQTSGEQNILCVNVEDLNRFEAGTVVTPELLKEAGIGKAG